MDLCCPHPPCSNVCGQWWTSFLLLLGNPFCEGCSIPSPSSVSSWLTAWRWRWCMPALPVLWEPARSLTFSFAHYSFRQNSRKKLHWLGRYRRGDARVEALSVALCQCSLRKIAQPPVGDIPSSQKLLGTWLWYEFFHFFKFYCD